MKKRLLTILLVSTFLLGIADESAIIETPIHDYSCKSDSLKVAESSRYIRFYHKGQIIELFEKDGKCSGSLKNSIGHLSKQKQGRNSCKNEVWNNDTVDLYYHNQCEIESETCKILSDSLYALGIDSLERIEQWCCMCPIMSLKFKEREENINLYAYYSVHEHNCRKADALLAINLFSNLLHLKQSKEEFHAQLPKEEAYYLGGVIMFIFSEETTKRIRQNEPICKNLKMNRVKIDSMLRKHIDDYMGEHEISLNIFADFEATFSKEGELQKLETLDKVCYKDYFFEEAGEYLIDLWEEQKEKRMIKKMLKEIDFSKLQLAGQVNRHLSIIDSEIIIMDDTVYLCDGDED